MIAHSILEAKDAQEFFRGSEVMLALRGPTGGEGQGEAKRQPCAPQGSPMSRSAMATHTQLAPFFLNTIERYGP